METIADAVNRLTAAGYRADFRAEESGLRVAGTACVHPPEGLLIDEVVRFEGISDPADEAIVFALRCPEHGVKGTYTVAYSFQMEPTDAEMMRRLNTAHL